MWFHSAYMLPRTPPTYAIGHKETMGTLKLKLLGSPCLFTSVLSTPAFGSVLPALPTTLSFRETDYFYLVPMGGSKQLFHLRY